MIRTAIALVLAASPSLAQTATPAARPARPGPSAKATPWTDKAAKGRDLYATFETSAGNIVIRLFAKDAPKTVANFVGLATGEREWIDPNTGQPVSRPLYDNTRFHRVLPQFMIQGGDPLGSGKGGPGYTFEDELKSGRAFDKPGLLAMANRGPATNGSQFFITEVPTPWLNGKHTIFGEVMSGFALVPKIVSMGNGAVTLKRVAIADKTPSK